MLELARRPFAEATSLIIPQPPERASHLNLAQLTFLLLLPFLTNLRKETSPYTSVCVLSLAIMLVAMRLIKVSSMIVEEFTGRNIPPYGILSHTWEGREVSYNEMRDGTARAKDLFHKIEMTCRLAAADGLAYVWIDTCCIDKSSSAELTEAINSMFVWYKRAAICYVFLSDLEPSADISTALKDCRWFRRGWTLQELIAPREVNFFDQDWTFKGRKNSLLEEISVITSIGSAVLDHLVPLSSVTVAARLSWAAHRETTREEDAAYCLLGIFDVNMPLLYGEGTKAFRRLQEEIIKATCDLSIFAWTAEPGQSGPNNRRYSGILADSLKDFSSCKSVIKTNESTFHGDFSVTNRGIRMHTTFIGSPIENSPGWGFFHDLGCSREDESSHLAVALRKCGPDTFIRERPSSLALLPNDNSRDMSSYRTIYILSKLPEVPWVPPGQMAQKENELIISCRTSAVQIRLPSGFEGYYPKPASSFDSQALVFFTTQNVSDSWCFMQLRGEFVSNGRIFPISCFFLCKDWNRGLETKMVSTLVNLNSFNPALLDRLVLGLEHGQHDILPRVMHDLKSFGIPVQKSAALREVSSKMRMSHTVRKVFLPNICKNETYLVEITLNDS